MCACARAFTDYINKFVLRCRVGCPSNCFKSLHLLSEYMGCYVDASERALEHRVTITEPLFLELCLEKCAELGTFLQTSPLITHLNAYKKYTVSLTWVISEDKYGIFKFSKEQV